MKLLNIKSAYSLAGSLYGVNTDAETFEDLALNAWELINNKHTRLYRYIGDVENGALQLPCNVDVIESVHIPLEDAQATSSDSSYFDATNIFSEYYIEGRKWLENPLYQRGKFVDYREGEDNTLYFKRNYPKVMVVYHGIIADEEDGLPLITEKEKQAIACYVAYALLFNEGLRKRDQTSLTLAQTLKADWLRLCNAARIPEHLSQNEMNEILDVKTRWDRKAYAKSYKPIV